MQQKSKIMIVDDNPIDQLITEYILTCNYQKKDILVMTSAIEALAYLAAHADIPEALPCLILLDLDMPVMNGYGFLQEFRTQAEHVRNGCKIVVITASEIRDDIEKMQADPLVAKLINKPLHRHSLVF